MPVAKLCTDVVYYIPARRKVSIPSLEALTRLEVRLLNGEMTLLLSMHALARDKGLDIVDFSAVMISSIHPYLWAPLRGGLGILAPNMFPVHLISSPSFADDAVVLRREDRVDIDP